MLYFIYHFVRLFSAPQYVSYWEHFIIHPVEKELSPYIVSVDKRRKDFFHENFWIFAHKKKFLFSSLWILYLLNAVSSQICWSFAMRKSGKTFICWEVFFWVIYFNFWWIVWGLQMVRGFGLDFWTLSGFIVCFIYCWHWDIKLPIKFEIRYKFSESLWDCIDIF
jgi:hypothetical protein